jgi:small-conductance mechanosensitive channel
VQIGRIEDLTLGDTVIKTEEAREIVVPNSVMDSQAIIKLA